MKQTKCKNCKQPFTKTQQLQVACSYSCAIELAKPIAKKVIERKERENKAKLKESLKTYTQKVNQVKQIFQSWIRKRDENLPCISCGATYSNPFWDGGHYKKAELYRGVIFNENNCAKQCRKCNFYQDGNEANYREELVKRIGLDSVLELELLAQKTKKYKYSDEELGQIKSRYIL